ncbi:hypothetical protein H8R18_01055 [Nanchangia anserum]|uniref:Uncharacterized protein n=1 Tax=Nanchangia anserum TaxID=2692125 RepID=A0A8I0KNZ7_9ACTO|nr:hypothetical protein [Nanchangia anserum]MBD3689826.1 hypothetical protein [Nanchangia anserum]QOX81996.1 hypothetical protein H8R18_01055 [Nanchangia anserum]
MGLMEEMALEMIRDWGGSAGELGMFIWPHLTPDDRAGLLTSGDGDPWAMIECVLELCPYEVAIPERLLTAFEEEAKEFAADGDAWGKIALSTIRRYRTHHAQYVAQARETAEAKAS